MQESNSCNRYRRCRQYRTCADCARLRQAHFADVAESLLSNYQALYQARFTPYINTEKEISRIKAAIKRQLDCNDAVWSVEQGEIKDLLHINLISPVQVFKSVKNSEYWQGEQVRNLRQIAAYIVKQDQIPSLAAYSGRQFGSFRSMAELYSVSGQAPIIQAAAAESIILKDWKIPTPYLERQAEIARMRQSNRSHSEIANDHLHKLRAYVAGSKRGEINVKK